MQHRNIPSTQAHEPKGIEAADVGSVYVSQGDGSGLWQPRVEGAITWGNAWIPNKQYPASTMVMDGLWTMISNKNTYDKPSPVVIGSEVDGFPDDPSFTTDGASKTINSGNRYLFSKEGWITELKVKVPEVGPHTTYKLYSIVTDAEDNAVINQITLPVLTDDTWIKVREERHAISVGQELLLVLQSIKTSTSDTVTGKWDFTNNDGSLNTPTVANWNHNYSNTLVRVHKTDKDTDDRTTDLLSVVVGSIITIHDEAVPPNSYTYNVTSITDGGDSIDYGVILESRIGIGFIPGTTTTITIDVPVLSNTAYLDEADYFLTHQPTFATVSGYLAKNGVVDDTKTNDAFSVDIVFQEGSRSPDWDTIAYSG